LQLGAPDAVAGVFWARNPLASLAPLFFAARLESQVGQTRSFVYSVSSAADVVTDKVHVGQIKVEMAHGKQLFVILADRDCPHADNIRRKLLARQADFLLCVALFYKADAGFLKFR
jgi:hypothetical protein